MTRLLSLKTNPAHYLARPIADAYNNAKNNHIGLFAGDINEILKEHGSTNLNAVKNNPNDRRSIYNYADMDY